MPARKTGMTPEQLRELQAIQQNAILLTIVGSLLAYAFSAASLYWIIRLAIRHEREYRPQPVTEHPAYHYVPPPTVPRTQTRPLR